MPPRSPDWQRSRASETLPVSALSQAIDLAQAPRLAAHMRRRPLPRDVLTVIRLASGCPQTTAAAVAATSRDGLFLAAAAELYLRQVVCYPSAGPYRMLGVTSQAPRAQMRQHMRELALWLHPDRTAGRDPILMQRVLEAWRTVDAAGRLTPDPPRVAAGAAPQAGRRRRASTYRPAWISQPLPKARRGQVVPVAVSLTLRVAIVVLATIVPKQAVPKQAVPGAIEAAVGFVRVSTPARVPAAAVLAPAPHPRPASR